MAWFTDRHFFLLAVIVYGLSAVYSVFLWRKGFRRDDRVNYWLLTAAFVLHSVALFKRGISLSACPVNNLYEATVFLLWALTGAYLIVGLLPRFKFLGTMVAPLLLCAGVFALMPALDPPRGPQPEFSGALRSLHAATILLAYGGFGLGAVAAGMLLTQRRDLKLHKVRAVLSLLPSMQRLESVTTMLVFVGFILFTVGLAAGRHIPRPAGMEYFSDPKVVWSALMWLAYLEIQVAHKYFGRSTRKFAWSVIICFAFLILTFSITNHYSSLHRS